jgi:hypothetical protein
MSKRRDRWDAKIHHHHTTRDDDVKDGIRRCASCGTIIVVGAECMACAKKHPITSAIGWLKWLSKK